MQLIFLDEAGFATNWKESISEQPFHVLGGVMIDSVNYFSACEELRQYIQDLNLVKLDNPLGHGFEIKAKEIARGAGWWGKNDDKRNAVRDYTLSFPERHDGTAFLVVIDKEKHLNQYVSPVPPHELAFKFMFERLQWKLLELNDEAICVYDQTKFLDDVLHDTSIGLIRDGSHIEYWSIIYGLVREKFPIDRIKEFYLGKSNNSIGLQVADYIATFGYQYFKTGAPADCGWWETLRHGLYKKNTTIEGYGLKVFP